MLTYVKLRRFNNHDDCYLELKKQSLFIIFCLDHQSSEDRQRKSLLWCAYLRLFADDDDSLVCISKSIIQVKYYSKSENNRRWSSQIWDS
jgi:hypothetical protein